MTAFAVRMTALALVILIFISNQSGCADGGQKSELISSEASIDNEDISSSQYTESSSKIVTQESELSSGGSTSYSSAISSSLNPTSLSPTINSNKSISTSSEVRSNTQSSLSPTSKPSISSEQDDKSVVLTGYIIDEDCFVSVGYSDPSKETRGCLNMAICAASGYGLAVLQDGKKYVFYYFDGTISGVTDIEDRIDNATGGQKYAWEFIDKFIQKDSFLVKVKGRFSGQKRTNPNIDSADGIYYDTFIVENIEPA